MAVKNTVSAIPAPPLSPMFTQYFGMKDEHPEAIVLMRVGDFYEAYGEDAETIARALQIALTAKDASNGRRIAMAGVPHHALEGYLARLVAQRYIVALAEQLEAPKPNKLVKRAVTRVITPGTVFEERLLDGARSTFLAAVAADATHYAFIYADLSTGECYGTVFSGNEAQAEFLREIARIAPAEILTSAALRESLAAALPDARLVDNSDTTATDDEFAQCTAGGFSRDESITAGRALARLHAYVRRVGIDAETPLGRVRAYRCEQFVAIDAVTRRHLDLTQTGGANAKATLFATLDKTRTAMGARLLARWISAPLLDPAAIAERADAVECLLQQYQARATIAETLDAIFDLERIAQKVRLRRALPRDLASLRWTLHALGPLTAVLATTLPQYAARIPNFRNLLAELERTLVAEPAANCSDGGVIRPDVDTNLAEAVHLRTNGRTSIAELEERERERSGIRAVKIKYSSAFGYGIEIPRSQSERVPPDWIRRQTLANAERYVTPELKNLEAAIASASERTVRLESMLFEALVERVRLDAEDLLITAETLATVDVCVAFAQIAGDRGYVRPQFHERSRIEVRDGRHPVIEALRGSSFVPNDLRLLDERERFLLITGPNMGGKSTFLRQTALLTIMAQIGSFVPAAEMRLGIVDRIFTRIGAGDDLASGRSTFYLEMAETAGILQNCTRASLVLIDEVGRGTGTADGLAIAQAICEYLLELRTASPMVLFATHFHELVDLADRYTGVANYHVTAVEQIGSSGEPVFSHRVLPGSTSRSFGIDVAKMAGLPRSVIERARCIAETLAEHAPKSAGRPRAADPVQMPKRTRGGAPKAIVDVPISPAGATAASPMMNGVSAQPDADMKVGAFTDVDAAACPAPERAEDTPCAEISALSYDFDEPEQLSLRW